MARQPKIYQVSSPVEKASSEKILMGDVAQIHPDLYEVVEDYRDMRNCAAGATQVKRAGEMYLPMPSGFRGQNDGGVAMYDAYRMRAQFPDIFAPTIQGMLGILHKNEASIEGMEEGSPLFFMHETATSDGLPLESLHKRISEMILTYGRAVALADVPLEGGDPYVAVYQPDALINWSENRDFFVLEEIFRIRNGYSWTTEKKYRVLLLEDGQYVVHMVSEASRSAPAAPAGRTDTTKQAEDEEKARLAEAEVLEPTIVGGTPLDVIPLVVAGSRDLSLSPDQIPLSGVANASLALYRLDADYRHQLFMSGQETLVFVGIDKADIPSYIGAGVALALPEGCTASYVSPTGRGIEAHAQAIRDERDVASTAGSRVFDVSQRGAESGDALRIRSRAASATLVSIALCSAAALEQLLRHCMRIVGGDPETIVVVPNLDFVDSKLTPQQAKELMELWMAGAISYQTFYDNLQSGEIASQERTAAEEQELAAQEQAATMDEEAAALGEAPSEEEEEDLGPDEGVSDEELRELFSPELLEQAGVPTEDDFMDTSVIRRA